MSDLTRLGRARGKTPAVALVAAATLAMLVSAPFASAALPSPISRGTTTLTLDRALVRMVKQIKIGITPVKPSSIRGSKAIFAVTGGSLELPTGAGEVTHSGGLKLRWGKKTVALKSFAISTKSRSLSAKVDGRTVKVGTLVGASVARVGFGDSISARRVKLTAAAAMLLDKQLASPSSHNQRGQKATKMKPPFRANMVIGSTVTEVEPTTVNVTPIGTLTYAGDPTLLGKLTNVGVEVQTIAPTAASGTTFTSGIGGGTISPLGTSGAINSTGGIRLVQDLQGGPTTTITLASFGADLAEKTATAEVVGESNAESGGQKPLNLGPVSRSSIGDLTITGVTPSPATRTVAVSATAVIQPVAAEVLEGLVKVYQGYYSPLAAKEIGEKATKEGKPITEEEAKKLGAKAAEEKVAADQIKAGEPLGSFAFLATGE